MDLVRLSKTISYALRHAPWEYELELDEEGWVPLAQFLDSLREERRYREVTREDIEAVLHKSAKQRFELEGQRIRALYGHSLPGKIKKISAQPPKILFHGTQQETLAAIQAHGLLPMRRQYVHLSIDRPTAHLVSSRKGDAVVILTVQAQEAFHAGVPFYEGNPQTWLADQVPPQWLDFPASQK